MKSQYVIPMLVLTSLTACNKQLTKTDRALIMDANNNAAEAKQMSVKALDEALAAQRMSDKTSKRVDRAFRASQNK